ncbi:hypothetical protein Scep_026234 [Stephania cephalantha]|uniref:Uncharacterized protein n=1 Tax=Stephania cephalantha TaxID=152367 RepID=A0AAP0EJR2_9MAGN
MGSEQPAEESESGEKASAAPQTKRFAPVGKDHQRRQAKRAAARRESIRARRSGGQWRRESGIHKESPQRSNDRRDTDHGGRTADLQRAGREMDAEAVAGEKKLKRDLKEMDGGWGLKLGFVEGKEICDLGSLDLWIS